MMLRFLNNDVCVNVQLYNFTIVHTPHHTLQQPRLEDNFRISQLLTCQANSELMSDGLKYLTSKVSAEP